LLQRVATLNNLRRGTDTGTYAREAGLLYGRLAELDPEYTLHLALENGAMLNTP
tara:strand:+ start:804 stop:965 length:162 start_codon:yes stop_codon:yes gene_type:complete